MDSSHKSTFNSYLFNSNINDAIPKSKKNQSDDEGRNF